MPPGIGYPPLEPEPTSGLPQTPMVPPSVAPSAPPAPPPSRFSPDAIVGLAALAASIIGGSKTAGLAQGVASGLQQNEGQRLQQQQLAQQQARIDAAAAEREAQRQAVMQRELSAVLMDVANKVPSFTDKAAYDRYINFIEQIAGPRFNLPPNSVRAQFPFVAPSAEQRAKQAVQDILKNPLAKNTIDLNHKVRFDRDGDGVDELVSFGQLVDIAKFNIFRDEQGHPIMGPEGPQEIGDKFKELLGAKLARFKAEKGRDPSPQEREAIIKSAVRETAEEGRREPQEALIPITETDPETGEVVTSLVPKRPGEVMRRPPREPNQAQFTAGAYAGRIRQSTEIIDALEGKIANMSYFTFETQDRLPAAAQSGTFQSYDQAGRNFINAVLRRESGAVISPAEFDNARRQYLPQPGDTPDTLYQKRANRLYVFQTMKRAAGRAYEEPVKPPIDDPAARAKAKLGGR